MNEQLENDFKYKIEKIRDKTHVLSFSTGSDSVACFLKLRENGIEPILIYYYFIYDLPMVNNYIDYFEKKFNVKIYKLPGSLWVQHINNALLQLPIRAREKFINRIKLYGLNFYTRDNIDKLLEKVLGNDLIHHVGLKYTDGIFRYKHLMKNGCFFKNNFYPIASYKVSDIQDILDKYDCKLPIEYKLWGISFEAPRAWNINLIKEHCPASYEKIREMFPLVGALGYRDKFNKLNHHFKMRLSQYKKYAIDKSMYEVW